MSIVKPTLLSCLMIIGFGVKAANAETRSYDVDSFNEVAVDGGIDVRIVIGDDFAVEAEALRGDLERLEIQRRGRSLNISREASWGLFGTGKRDRFVVRVTMPTLGSASSGSGSSMTIDGLTDDVEELTASGGASLTAEGSGDTLEVYSSGGADLEVMGPFGDVFAEVSGGASMELAGSCATLYAKSSGGASLRAEDLRCDAVDADASGGASLRARASEFADLEASSGASIRLSGNADVIHESESGGASIRLR